MSKTAVLREGIREAIKKAKRVKPEAGCADAFKVFYDEKAMIGSLLKLLDDNNMVFQVEKDLPKPKLSEDALDAIDVKGVFPHVANAITLALAHQSKAVQQDMVEANWHPIERIKL